MSAAHAEVSHAEVRKGGSEGDEIQVGHIRRGVPNVESVASSQLTHAIEAPAGHFGPSHDAGQVITNTDLDVAELPHEQGVRRGSETAARNRDRNLFNDNFN